MDIALHKAHELGYDEHKPRLKEARVNISMVIKRNFSFSKISIEFFLSDFNQRRIFRTIIESIT